MVAYPPLVARRAVWVVLTVVLATLASGTNGGAATNALGWSGTVSASFSASGQSGQAQSSQQLDMQVTLADGKVASGTVTVHYAYSSTNSCGTNTIKGDGSGPETSVPSIYPESATTYGVAVGLGLYSSIKETSVHYDVFNHCTRKDDSNPTASLSLGVPTVTAPGNVATAKSLSGSQTLTKGTGCAIGQPDQGSGYDTCTLKITWHLTKGKPCDPELLAKAERKYEIAAQLAEAGQKELEHASEVASEVVKQYGIDFAAEQGVVKTLEAASKRAAQKAGEVYLEAGEVVGLVYELGKIDEALTGELIPAAVELRQLERAALKDFQSSEAEVKKAKADLDAALAQGPCVGPARDELNKLERKAADDEAVHKLVDSWQAAGSNDLYVVNHELVDERAATEHARTIVRSARATQSAQAPPRRLSKQQVDTALADMRRAVGLNRQGAAKLKSVRDRDKALHRRVATLLR